MNKQNKRVCVYLDGSSESINALLKAIDMAHELNLSLYTVYIVNSELINKLTLSKLFALNEANEFKKSIHEDAVKYSQLAKNMALNAKIQIETLIVEGSLIDSFTKIVQDYDISFIIIGLKVQTTGKSLDVDKIRLIEELKCDVYVVKKLI